MSETEAATLCSVAGCDGKQYKEGYCVPHYVELVQSKEKKDEAAPPADAAPAPAPAASEPAADAPAPSEPAAAPPAEAPAVAPAEAPAAAPAEAAAPAPAPVEASPAPPAAAPTTPPPAEPAKTPSPTPAAESLPPAVEPPKEASPPPPATPEKRSPSPNVKVPSPAPRTGGFGGGGVPCNVCSKTTYPAELVVYEGMNFHRACFKCTKCCKKIEQNSQAAKFEGKVYCRACFDREGFARKQTKVQWQPKASTGASATKSGTLGGGGVPCATCGKTVYVGEAVSFETKVYHKKCLKCSECGVECTVNSAGKFEEKLFCKRCFEKGGYARKQAQVKFVPRESKPASGALGSLGGGGQKCTACSKTVYPAEAVLYEGKNYHNKCFRCEHCKSELKVSQAEHKGPTPYCKKCYYALNLHQATLNPAKPKEEAAADAAPAPAPSS